MKKLILVLMLSVSSIAHAGGLDCRTGVDHKHPACYTTYGQLYQVNHNHHNHHRHHGHHGSHNNAWWVAPAVIGIIGYELGRQQNPVVLQQNPVVIQQQNLPTVITPVCGPWIEIQNVDGTIVRQRTCTQ